MSGLMVREESIFPVSERERTYLGENGSNYREYISYFAERELTVDGHALKDFMLRFFHLSNHQLHSPIKCCSDVIRGERPDSEGQPICDLTGVIVYGIILSGGMGVEEPVVSHFFARRFLDYYGFLSDWKKTFKFPTNAKEYTVFAVLPDDFVMPYRSKCSIQNLQVMTYTQSELKKLGIREDEIWKYLHRV